MEKVKFDALDKRILDLLDIDSRQPLSSLSTKLKRSKQVVLFRMNRLEEKGVIRGYNAIVDTTAFGFMSFRTYFKLKNTPPPIERKLVEFLEPKHYTWALTRMHGKWDYALFSGFKNIPEFHSSWMELMIKFKPFIAEYRLAVYAPILNLNRVFSDSIEERIVRTYGASLPNPSLDEKDFQIAKALSENARESSARIAQKVGLSEETVRKRVKALEKNKVIAGYKLDLNTLALGKENYRIDVSLNSLNKLEKIYSFCKNNPLVYQINQSKGNADLELEVIVDSQSELFSFMDSFKTAFPETISSYEYYGFSTFHKLSFVPD